MNALKRKVDEGTQNTQDGITKMQKEVQDRLADTHVGIAKMQKELSQETLELKGQLSEILQLLRSKP